ncbi:MAG: Calx-beta domain-containing protein [Paludisphaera borealis]|uniref:Calx-beta domain-containing protein n=1 Tax=Paludisphaera borealis TaxID=1387353 RepID=UPI00283F32C7|nr:Calx-beta domain-containing protein [Paludisphaera borealis]MDR3621387.1 Calx-beta domain-containing protein [Paludisphaera borealis]
MLSTFTVENTADDGAGSLRWAILQVNADTSPSTIQFAIPGAGVRTIALTSALEPIIHPVTIDARTQPAYSGQPLVKLDGSALPMVQNGLVISAGDSTVAGLIISGFQGAGILLTTGGGNLVTSNYIGVGPQGISAHPNGDGVVILASSHNTIGGGTGAGNLISGNQGNGVKITGTSLDTIGNQVSGNLIGTTLDGLRSLGNGSDGVLLSGGRGAIIGGIGAGLGNVISGNKGNGLELNSGARESQITGNAIGLAVDGVHAVANLRDGVLLNSAPANTIGGLTAQAANQISGNNGSGIRTQVDTTGLVVQGNQIGTDASGRLVLGNLGNGLTLGTGSNSIGGMSMGAGNTIAYNGTGAVGSGVQLMGLVTGVTILSNSIHHNANLGINFGDGPTLNHPTVHGPGPNNWQNYPILSTAQSDGQSTLASGTLSGGTSQSYTIQFFWSDLPDPSGFGQGKLYLGSISVTTDASGAATFTPPTLGAVAPGGFISATATDAQGDTSEFSQAVLVQPVSDVSVQLTANPNPASPGAAVTYTATVKNTGNLIAHHVVLTAQLPMGATIGSSSGSQGSSPVIQGGTLTAALGSLLPGASAVVVVVVQPPAGFLGNLISTAQVTMDEVDAHPGDNSTSVSVRIAATADLNLKLTAGPPSGHVGDLLTYELTVSNAGPDPASNAVLILPFASNTSYVSASGTQGAGVLQSDRLIVNLGSIASGGQARITVVLKATGLGTIASTASVTSDAYDPNLIDDFASLATMIRPQADLRLVMQAPPVAADGYNVVYWVTIFNAGPDAAEGVTIQDLLPSRTAYVAASVDGGGAVSFANGIVTAVVGHLASGASTTLWIVAVPSLAVGTTLINAAHVGSTVDDPNDADNSDWRQTPVRPLGDLAVAMLPMSPSVPRGQPATFGVLVVNQGPSTEPNAVLSIPLPDWATFVSASSNQGAPPALAGGVLTARLGTLEPGGMARLTLVLTPKASATGPFTVTAAVQGDDADFNQVNNTAVASVTLAPSSDLSVVVTPPSGPVHERSIFAYSVVVTANGPDDASGVAIRAPLPAGVEFVSAASSQGPPPQLDAGIVVAQVGSLAVGQSAALTVFVRPTAPADSTLSLAGSGVEDPFNPTSGVASPASIMVQPTVDLAVSLTSLQAQTDVGQYVTWVSSVANWGPSAATGVVLNLPLANAWAYVASTTTQGVVQSAAGQVSVQLGTLAPGAVATVVLVLTPTVAGTSSLSALVGGDQYDLNPADDQASGTVTVQESPGAIEFSQPSFTVPENAGSATIPVYRTLGARGTVTVPYATFGGNATPGVDYLPVSGVLSFGPGETVQYITVPVLPNPHDNHDEGVGLYLGAPTGGAVLGGRYAVPLTIQDIDPDFTPPQVQWVHLNGDSTSITSLTIGFSEPLSPGPAFSSAGYGILDLGASGGYGAGDNSWIAFSAPSYDPSTQTVTITPTQPLATGHNYAIRLVGTGPSAITDLAGNPLGGGVDYASLFARGASLNYTDSTGNLVSFQVTGGGFLDVTRNVAGDAQVVTLQQGAPGYSVLSGSVARQYGRGSGVTAVGAIEGLGAFGQIRVNLKSPPFLVKNYPFALSTGKPIPAAGRQPISPRVPPIRPRPVAVRPVPAPKVAALRHR